MKPGEYRVKQGCKPRRAAGRKAIVNSEQEYTASDGVSALVLAEIPSLGDTYWLRPEDLEAASSQPPGLITR